MFKDYLIKSKHLTIVFDVSLYIYGVFEVLHSVLKKKLYDQGSRRNSFTFSLETYTKSRVLTSGNWVLSSFDGSGCTLDGIHSTVLWRVYTSSVIPVKWLILLLIKSHKRTIITWLITNTLTFPASLFSLPSKNKQNKNKRILIYLWLSPLIRVTVQFGTVVYTVGVLTIHPSLGQPSK